MAGRRYNAGTVPNVPVSVVRWQSSVSEPVAVVVADALAPPPTPSPDMVDDLQPTVARAGSAPLGMCVTLNFLMPLACTPLCCSWSHLHS